MAEMDDMSRARTEEEQVTFLILPLIYVILYRDC